MSTILDALKKSEQERKRNDVPTLADLPAPEEASRWPLYLGLLAMILLLAVIAWLLMSRAADGESQEPVGIVLNNETVAADSQARQDDQIIVNVVSYSAQPELRFVMVDGKMYRQGEFVRAGLKVVEIQTDSVIFNHRGRRVVRKP